MRTATCPVKPNNAVARPTYRPRRPRRSPLYQILEDHFESFLLCYEERFRNRYGPLRLEIARRTVYKYLDCGILERGFARVVCPECKAEFLIGFSCKTRFCPSCHAKKLTLWSNRLVEELLTPIPHRMFTLTVPKRIRPFFLWDRKLLGSLAQCASESIKQFYRLILSDPTGTPGIITSIQTFGNQAANYHPHVHCLAADGLFASGDTFRSPSFISAVDISDLFRREVLKTFVEQELIPPQQVAENMLSWPHSGFNVHIGTRLHSDDHDALGATLRYAARAPISLQRLHYDREIQTVAYGYTSAYDHREHIDRLSALELIARLTTHIPGRYERVIRYYGVYSSRTQGVRRARATGGKREEIEERSPPAHLRRQWQLLLSRVFGITLTCHTCHTEMKIIAVITQDEPIHKILAHLRSRKIDPRAGPFAEQAA
jgi:hypothetical protein